uniref:Tropomodulin 2 n=1 Tax=Moschus moschiferus TaxID=68415 RepID=A0A8C6FH72_MOSMO
MALPFQKELEKYKNIDEDELLGKLSEEELKQLENVLDDLDPESALLPAGFRQKDQTQKAATGPSDREHLLMYLEKEALEQKDREDFVPFTGEKKGRRNFFSQAAFDFCLVSFVYLLLLYLLLMRNHPLLLIYTRKWTQ